MDVQLIGFLIFIILLTAFLLANRKKLEVQKIFFPALYFLLYRTKIGIKQMDWLGSKHPRLLDVLAKLSILTGFIGMAVMCIMLVDNFIKMVFVPAAAPGVALVLPVKIKGTFYVPFFYWIISVFVLAIVHEFSHGVFARRYRIKIKSSGFAFLGIFLPVLPAAFVEPDEKQLARKKPSEQLAVLSAGAFSNIVLAFIILGLMITIVPKISDGMMHLEGVSVAGFNNATAASPSQLAGVQIGEVIQSIDAVPISSSENFTLEMAAKKPGQVVNLITNASEYNITLASKKTNQSAPYIGLAVTQNYKIRPEVEQRFGKALPSAVVWIVGLFNWLFILNLGIGLFNLVPIGPVDGGRMLKIALHKLFKKDKADSYFKAVSFLFLALVIVNIAFSFFK